MIWLRTLRGLKVIRDGKCLGRAVQGCLCDSLTALDGFWLDRAIAGMRFVSAEHICVLGERSIVIDYPGERLRMKPQPLMLRAVSTDGKRLGAIVDAGINESTLAVEELALSPGWAEGLMHGFIRIRRFKCDLANARVIVPQDEGETEVFL